MFSSGCSYMDDKLLLPLVSSHRGQPSSIHMMRIPGWGLAHIKAVLNGDHTQTETECSEELFQAASNVVALS